MIETFTSERLLRELPRPLLHFLWYLWDTYCDPSELEFRITLQGDGDVNGKRLTIHATGATLTQDFGCAVNADILIRKIGTRVFMEYG